MQICNKRITTVVSDLDGTLLRDRPALSDEAIGLIRKMRREGVRFIAASGRQYKNMRLLFEPVLDDTPFICENGSIIIKDHKTIYKKCIPEELAYELLNDLLLMKGTEIIVSSDGYLNTLADRREFAEELAVFFASEVKLLESYRDITGEMNKISIWWRDGIPRQRELWFHEKYDDRLHVVDGGNGWLDFTMTGVDKGSALEALAGLEGFSMEETMCFGDSENDIAMFRAAGISYAMDTAREHVKAEADFICGSVEEVLRQMLAPASAEKMNKCDGSSL